MSERRRGAWLRLALGPAAGAIAILAAWTLLERIAWTRINGLASSESIGAAAARFTGALFLVGALAGIFGGMVAALVAQSRRRVLSFGVGALSAAILAGGSALSFYLGKSPALGASASAWIVPLMLCSGIGAWAFSFTLAQDDRPATESPLQTPGPIYRRNHDGTQ